MDKITLRWDDRYTDGVLKTEIMVFGKGTLRVDTWDGLASTSPLIIGVTIDECFSKVASGDVGNNPMPTAGEGYALCRSHFSRVPLTLLSGPNFAQRPSYCLC